MRRFKILFTITLWLGAGGRGVAASSDDWFSDEAGKLAMMVAKLENDKLCGGVLRVNRASHVLLFEPAPSEMGCKNGAEASSAEVKSVKPADGPGFVVELQTGKEKKLLLMPLPHAQWLLAKPSVKANQLAQQMEGMVGAGKDGTPIHVGGGSSSAGAKAKAVEIPPNVQTDTKRAVDAVLSALGR